jgi:hypothetical protein
MPMKDWPDAFRDYRWFPSAVEQIITFLAKKIAISYPSAHPVGVADGIPVAQSLSCG